MSKSNRANVMTSVVFRKDNIEELSKAFAYMCETWLDIASGRSHGHAYTIREIQTKLDSLLQKKWKTIQDVFLKDTYHDYASGVFNAEEECLHAKLVMDLIKHVDDGYVEITTMVDELYNNDKKLKNEIQTLQCENLKLQEELTQDRWKLNQAVTDANNSAGRISQVEQLNKEKTELIVQLQRDATVELWGKEKIKILEKANENFDPEELTKQHVREKIVLRDKIKDLEMQIKKSKMSAQLKSTQENNTKGLEEEKKYSFLLEKDLRKFDEELFNLQKQIIGLLGGLYTKFSPIFLQITHAEDMAQVDPCVTEELGKVEEIIREAYSAACDGTLSEYVSKLGIYYQAQDSQIRKVVVRKITACHNINGRGSPVMSSRGLPSILPGLPPDVKKPTFGIKPLLKQLSKADLKGNPTLLNKVTGEVNMIAVLKYFPFLLKEDIQDSWDQFRRYDKNSDGTLDLTEVMTAMGNSFGDTFRAPQIRDAMMEVDSDGSGDLDFFEFISVVNMLKNRTGRAEVYRNEAVQLKSRKMSKVCLVM